MMVLFFVGAVALLVLAAALGFQAGRERRSKVRRSFWFFLVSGLLFSALFLGWAGEWWLAAGPLLPLFLIFILRVRFPLVFAKVIPPEEKPEGEKEEDRNQVRV